MARMQIRLRVELEDGGRDLEDDLDLDLGPFLTEMPRETWETVLGTLTGDVRDRLANAFHHWCLAVRTPPRKPYRKPQLVSVPLEPAKLFTADAGPHAFELQCGICGKPHDACDCAQTGRR